VIKQESKNSGKVTVCQPPKIQRLLVIHNKKFSCEICKKGVGTKGGLIYHMKAHLFGKPFKCEICSRSYATKNDFDTHYKRHAGQTFSCDVCAKKYKVKQYLADHISAAHLPKVIPCTQCKRKFASKGVLKKHIYVIHMRPSKAKKFLCKLCGLAFPKFFYQRHCSLRELLKYKCQWCGKKFPCNKLLDDHRKEEIKQKSFCKMCKKSVGNYQLHFYRHHGNYQCDICSFKTNKSALNLTHQKSCGTKEQIRSLGYHCEICDEYFRSKILLGYHNDGKHGKFKCFVCSKTFNNKNNLNHHVRDHRKRKNHYFKCVLCPDSRNFRNKEFFDKHFNSNHSTFNLVLDGKRGQYNGYLCDKCRIRLKTKENVLKHVLKCYKID